MNGRQNRLDHAGRSNERPSPDDVKRARATLERFWQEAKKAHRAAYGERHSNADAAHAAQVRLAVALWRTREARERLRRCEAAHGAVALNAKEVTS